MNIAHIVLSLNCGGLERMVIDLARQLKKEGLASTIICLEEKGVLACAIEDKDITIFEFKKRPGFDIGLIFNLAKFFKKQKFNLVHTHNIGPLIYGNLAAKLVGIPTLNTHHGQTNQKAPRFIWHMNKTIVAVSQDTKRFLLESNRLNPSKVQIIYNGIDPFKFNSETEAVIKIKETIGIHDHRFIIGHVGRLSPEKDQTTLLKAFASVQKKTNAQLLIVGDGPLRSSLEQLADELKIKSYVTFLGYRRDITDILTVMDLFVLPSQHEGLSLSLLEAMAAAKPIIATDVGGTKEVIEHRKTGLLIPAKTPQAMAQAFLELYQNHDLAHTLAQAAQQKVRHSFSLDKMSQKYIETYKGILSNS